MTFSLSPGGAALRALASCAATQVQPEVGTAGALVILLIGLAICAAGVRLILRLCKTPCLTARDLGRQPPTSQFRVRAAVHSSNPLSAQLVAVPLLYSRVALLERRTSPGQSNRYEYVEIASQPAEWAEDCFVQDTSGQFPLRWGNVSPRLAEESQSCAKRQAAEDPRIAALFASFVEQDKPNLRVCESFIPEGSTLMLWGHCEEDPAMPEGKVFRVTEISPPHEGNAWARACTGIALGLAVAAAGLLMGYRAIDASSADDEIPTYGPPTAPVPLKR